MSVVRVVIIFLLGVGAALGALAAGLADRLPRFAWRAEHRLDQVATSRSWDDGHWRENGWHGDDQSPLAPAMIIRLSDPGGDAEGQQCSRVLIVRNNTDKVIAAELAGPGGSRVVVPPSSTVASSDTPADLAAGYPRRSGPDGYGDSDSRDHPAGAEYTPPYAAGDRGDGAASDDAGYAPAPPCPPQRVEIENR